MRHQALVFGRSLLTSWQRGIANVATRCRTDRGPTSLQFLFSGTIPLIP